MANFCNACGQPLSVGAKFCKGCGKAMAGNGSMTGWARQAAGLLAQTTAAPAASGEITIALPKAPPILKPLLTTGQILSGGIGGYFKNMGKAFAKPQRLIPALLLAAAWIVSLILGGDEPSGAVKLLSTLTFARGGMDANPLYAMGGVFGKGVVAMLVSQLFTGGFWRGLAGAFNGKRLSPPRLADMGALLLGAGLALAAFNFATGSPGLGDAVVALSGVLMSLKALGSKGGFAKRLLLSFGAKKQTARPALVQTANRALAGGTVGWALAVPLTAVPFGFACYIAGGVMVIAGFILLLAGGGQKGVART